MRVLERLLSSPAVFQAFKRGISGTERHCRELIRAQPGDRVLDIGCGTGDVLEHLGEVEYVGFDLSLDYVTRAQRKYAGRGVFFCGALQDDVAVQHGAFDLVLATGVLHHLSDDDARSLLRVAAKALTPAGRLVTLDGCYTPQQSRIRRWLLAADRGGFVRTEPEYLALARSVFGDVRAKLVHDLLRIPYTHLVMECSAAR
jgi:SAM-dependent methyltransferase